MDKAFLSILFDWANLTGNTDFQDILTLAEIRRDSEANFKEDLELFQAEHPDGGGLAGIIFILNLSNPVAYTVPGGYVANGSGVDTAYTSIGSGDFKAMSKTPADVAALTIDFLP